MPKLMIVAPSAYTLSGLATWLDYLLPGLQEKGWDVTLGLVSGPRYHQPEPYLLLHPFAKTVNIHCHSVTAFGRVAALRTTIRKINPDIVLSVNIPDALIAVGVERNLRKSNTRAVMTCHGIQQDLFTDMRKLSKTLDQVICTNELACRLAEEIAGIEASRIQHVAYGTEVPGELLATAANDTFTVAFAGRLEQDQKRIHDLTEIAANLKSANVPFRFLIAGSGPEKHDLLRKLESNGLLDQFEFLDFIEPQFLKERLYSRADALIVTSTWETGPIVIWEAMAAGLPVVTSRYIGSGAERLLWHEDNCLMFDIGDAAEAARQIRVLATDSNLLNSIRVNAFKTVQQKLSHDISVQNWDRVLRAAMELPHLPVHRSKYGLKRSDGRLDRMIGLAGADFIRRVMRRPPPDSGAGGEWPHTISKNIMSNESFWALAEKLDER